MKIPVIKELVESQSLEALKKAEEALLNEEKPEIDIKGEDEGEQLTHAFAAIWILEKMQSEELDFKTAMRKYTEMVRNSIN
ncbi:MAG: hypothetical protein SFU27_11465 [Thermonemataceae bacterium]|nr:hypothetical protein [Thermonemataceae bacterium]